MFAWKNECFKKTKITCFDLFPCLRSVCYGITLVEMNKTLLTSQCFSWEVSSRKSKPLLKTKKEWTTGCSLMPSLIQGKLSNCRAGWETNSPLEHFLKVSHVLSAAVEFHRRGKHYKSLTLADKTRHASTDLLRSIPHSSWHPDLATTCVNALRPWWGLLTFKTLQAPQSAQRCCW